MKSESLVRGGVMTMTPTDNLDDGFSSVVFVHLVLVVKFFVCALEAIEYVTVGECVCDSFRYVFT